MTVMLEEAIAQVKQLPDEQQDAIATLICEEIADEARWDSAFHRSQKVLERLAAEADSEDRKGSTRELDADAL